MKKVRILNRHSWVNERGHCYYCVPTYRWSRLNEAVFKCIQFIRRHRIKFPLFLASLRFNSVPEIRTLGKCRGGKKGRWKDQSFSFRHLYAQTIPCMSY